MSLLSLFEELSPVFSLNGPSRPKKRCRPYHSLLDTLEDQMDQQVGFALRRLPSLLCEPDEFVPQIKKRRTSDKKYSLNDVEPRCKALISTEDGKFSVNLDTSGFSPDDITVKVSGDKIGISAKHESKGDDVYELHEIYRSFSIPGGVDPDSITSRLSTSGHLTVEAPLKAIKDVPGERTVTIERSSPKAVEQSPAKKTVEDK